MTDDARCYQQIIYAVIAMAMRDSFRCPLKSGKLDDDAESALNFMFSNDIDVWLELIDIDAAQFKTRLKDAMWSGKALQGKQISEEDKRCFRINYKRWYQKKNERELMGLGYRATYE